MRVVWDSRKPPRERVLSVHLSEEQKTSEGTLRCVRGEEVPRGAGKKYSIVSRQYMVCNSPEVPRLHNVSLASRLKDSTNTRR